MKVLAISIFLFIPFLGVTQNIQFSDSVFKETLIDRGIDTDNDGEISISEANAVDSLSVNNASSVMKIKSLDGIEYFENLIFFDCAFNEISNLTLHSFHNLKYLVCNDNMLTSLDLYDLPSLQFLTCHENRIDILNLHNFPALEEVLCIVNRIHTVNLSNLPVLNRLIIRINKLKSLDLEDLPSLHTISCSNNDITSLNLDLPALKIFDCYDNKLEYINFSNFLNLEILSFEGNLLTSLDLHNLPVLNSLNLAHNKLSSLPNLDLPMLEYLRVHNNQLDHIELGGLPSLNYIDYSLNTFSNIDLSGVSNLTHVDCRNNYYLETLNLKTGNNIIEFKIDGSESLEYLCVNDSEVQKFQGIIDELGYNTNVNSYCSFTLGGSPNVIQGTSFFNSVQDKCFVDGTPLPYLKMHIEDGVNEGFFSSNANATYSISLPEAEYRVSPTLPNQESFEINPQVATINFPGLDSSVVQNFCLSPKDAITDIEIVLFPLQSARSGFNTELKIVYKNTGTIPSTGNISLEFQSELMDLFQSFPAQDEININVIRWSFDNLEPFESRSIVMEFTLNSPMDIPPLQLGDIINFKVHAEPFDSDNDNANNTSCAEMTVVSSHDPNDKTCIEGEQISKEMAGEHLHYLIRFENTGTAEAINVVIKDNIDLDKFDIRSLELIDASDDVFFRVDSNEVEFIFENIMLPFDDVSNDGYVVFKIKTLSDLVIGDVLQNKAEIYFDFNFPIITNTATTNIVNLSTNYDVDDIFKLTIKPNPTLDFIEISCLENMKSLAVYNSNGALIKQFLFVGESVLTTIQTTDLLAGQYFLKVVTRTKKVVVKKFIKI